MRSRISKQLSPGNRSVLKYLRWWLEKNWFNGNSDGWSLDVSVLIAQIVGTDRFKLFSGRVHGMEAPTKNDSHVYGLLDGYFIVDLTLDGFRFSSGDKGPRIVALPEWSPFVQSTYRYFGRRTRKLNDQVRRGRKHIPQSRWNSVVLRAFQGEYREQSRYWTLKAKPQDHRTRKQLQASRWALHGHRAVWDGKVKPVIRAFRKARSLDPAIELPTYLGPALEKHVTKTDS